MKLIGIALALLAAILFGAFVLLGAWIDGRRQALRDKGLHPVTTADGQVEAIEFETSASEATKSNAREQVHGTGSDERQNDKG